MATTKTTKTVTKRPTRKAAAEVLNTVYVISERSRILSWDPVYFTEDRTDAYRQLADLEGTSIYGSKGYKVTSVKHLRNRSA